MAHIGGWFLKHDGGVWLESQTGGSGQVKANIAKLRLFDFLVPVGAALGRQAAEKLRPRPGSWIWSDSGDNVEKLRVLTIQVPVPLFLGAGAEGLNAIRLNWTEIFADFDGVEIWRMSSDAADALITTVLPNVKTYLDSGLDASKIYRYHVRYVKVGVTGRWSNNASAQPYAYTAATGLVATPASSAQINLAWTDTSSGETGFEVQRKLPTDTDWVTVTITAANAVAYSNTGLSPETRYLYRVRPVGSGLIGPWSNEAFATTLPLDVALLDSDLTRYGRASSAPSGGIYTTLLDSLATNGDDNSYIYATQKHRCDEAITGSVEVRITNPTGANHGYRFWIGLFTSDGGGPLDGSGGGYPTGYGPSAGFQFEASQPATAARVKGFTINPSFNSSWLATASLVDGNWHTLRVKYDFAASVFRLYLDGSELGAVAFSFDFLTTLRAYKTTTPAMFRTTLVLFAGATYLHGSAARSNVEIRNPSYQGTVTPPPPNTWP